MTRGLQALGLSLAALFIAVVGALYILRPNASLSRLVVGPGVKRILGSSRFRWYLPIAFGLLGTALLLDGLGIIITSRS